MQSREFQDAVLACVREELDAHQLVFTFDDVGDHAVMTATAGLWSCKLFIRNGVLRLYEPHRDKSIGFDLASPAMTEAVIAAVRELRAAFSARRSM